MNFLKTLQQSLYSPPFYKQILETRIKSGLLYYFLLVLLLSTIQILLSIPAYLDAQKQLTNTASQLISAYPIDLEFTINDGKLSTTAQEPYVIPIPPSSDSVDESANLLVINTQIPYSTEQFRDYDTLAWATRDMVYYQESKDDIRSVSYQNIDDFTLNKFLVESTYKNIQPYFVWIAPGIGIAHALGLLFWGGWRLIYLLLLAAFLLLVGKMFSSNLTWKQTFKLLLYIVTLPLLITTLLSVLQVLFPLPHIPWVFTTLTVLAFIANILHPFKSTK